MSTISTTAPGLECLELEVDPIYTWNSASTASDNSNETAQGSQTEPLLGENFQYKHGRRYYAVETESYSLPNDDIESQRLDLQNLSWKLSLQDGLHLAPVTNEPRYVVDLGAGTGLWAIDFAKAHPQCKVLGTDLSSIQPVKDVPSNCSFITQNFNETWEFPEPIDLIHGRMLALGVRSWDRFFEQAYQNLKPGGWLDLQEVIFTLGYIDDGNVTDDMYLPRFQRYAIEATSKFGTDLTAAGKFKDLAIEKGFINVRHEWLKWPVGPWPKQYSKEKEIGAITRKNTRDYFLEGLALRTFTTGLGWSEQQARDFVADVKEELEDANKHYYWNMVHLCSNFGDPYARYFTLKG